MIFCCPICKQKLEIQADKTAKCANRHSFDRAKEGYYHLLLPSGRGVHGDDRRMVDARRAFLSFGHYAPLADLVASYALRLTPRGGTLLDAGCGDGYYTDRIQRGLCAAGAEVAVCGFDISRDAVRRAAKRNPSLSLAVAGSYHIPMADGAIDTVVDLFSPLADREFHRVLKKDGVFLMAIPAEDHLFELKAAIYETPYRNEPKDPAIAGFDLLASERLTYPMRLAGREEIAALFGMTPYAYRTSAEGVERLRALDRLTVQADFLLFAYRKHVL